MLAAAAQGKSVGVPARTLIYTNIQQLVGPPAGTYAPFGGPNAGTYLHWLYNGNLNVDLRSSSDPTQPDYVSQQILVEFEAPGVFTVPFDGTIQLIGGFGQYLFWVYYDKRAIQHESYRLSPGQYTPELHTLRTFTRVGQTVTVPANHQYILGYNANDTWTIVGTGDIIQPSVNLPGTPIQPGTQLIANQTTHLITGWLG
jgi:hypothetical protein